MVIPLGIPVPCGVPLAVGAAAGTERTAIGGRPERTRGGVVVVPMPISRPRAGTECLPGLLGGVVGVRLVVLVRPLVMRVLVLGARGGRRSTGVRHRVGAGARGTGVESALRVPLPRAARANPFVLLGFHGKTRAARSKMTR